MQPMFQNCVGWIEICRNSARFASTAIVANAASGPRSGSRANDCPVRRARVTRSGLCSVAANQRISRGGQSIGRSRPSYWPRHQAPRRRFGELTHVELVHLVLQRAQRNSQVLSRAGHVPAALLQRAQDEVALEGIGGFLEQVVAARALAARAGRNGIRAAGPLPRCSPCR